MLRLRIETDNAAFEYPAEECARILRKLADDLDNNGFDGCDGLPLMDYNGNRVGKVETDNER